MEEKIKIYIPESVNNILLKDMERFEFYKKDDSLNKNEFYNTLIVNYYEQFEESQSNLFSHIRDAIKEKSEISHNEINEIAADILQYVDVRTYQLDKEKYDVAIAMKPTKRSMDDIEYIQDYLLRDSTLSNYFRNMFASYALLPQDKRETIIFKRNFELVKEAIEKKRKIYFSTINYDNPHIVSPYAIANSKEELFNYLLCRYKDIPYSFRMSRIRQVKILNESIEEMDEMTEVFEKMMKYGPQFSYEIKKTQQPIVVRLTERGQKQFKAMYLHRPQPYKIEGDLYYFDCSRSQAFQYFSRLGSNAMVLEPADLIMDLHRFFSFAERKYRKADKALSNDSNDEEMSV